MKRLILLVILISNIQCHHDERYLENKKFFNNSDTLIFKQKGFNSGMELLLTNKGDFNYMNHWAGCVGGGEQKSVNGTFKLKNNSLILFPDSIRISTFPFSGHSDPTTKVYKYTSDSLQIKTKFDILKWNNITYLLSPEKEVMFKYHMPIFIVGIDNENEVNNRNEYYEFAMNYNSGYEPEFHGKYLIRIDNPNKDSINPNLDLKKIPKEWRSLFLKNPISATVTKLDKRVIKYIEDEKYNFEQKLVYINKGKKDSVINGLTFSNKNNSVTIIKVFEDESIGVADDIPNSEIKIGTILKTR